MKHKSNAIEGFLLMTFLAFILFHPFLYLNVKPAIRMGKSKIYWAKVIGNPVALLCTLHLNSADLQLS